MKTFAQYSDSVRTQVVRTLSDAGELLTMDVSSEHVLEMCAAVEAGSYKPTQRTEKPMYTWSPEMVIAYENHINGMKGERLSLDYAAAVACRAEGRQSAQRGEPSDAGGWDTASNNPKDHKHVLQMNKLHAEGFNSVKRH